MASKGTAFLLAAGILVAGLFFVGTEKSPDPSIVFAQNQGNHFALTAGTYRFGGDPKELSTVVLLDTQSGKTWYMRVRVTTTAGGQNVNSVEWAPMGYASQ